MRRRSGGCEKKEDYFFTNVTVSNMKTDFKWLLFMKTEFQI